MKIENSTAIVTGGSGGIGYAVAAALARQGASTVGVVDLSSTCQDAVRELLEAYPQCTVRGFEGDVTEESFRKNVFSELESDHSPVNICVPAAGIVRDGLAVRLDSETGDSLLYPQSDFEKILDVNLVHPVYWAMETIASVARDRARRGLGRWTSDEKPQGAVVLIGSVSSRGNRGQVGYAAAKSALIGASATLNIEGLFYGVQSKIIHPGFVDTPMVETIDPQYFEDNLKPLIGLGRKIRPAEIADIVCAMIEYPVLSGQVWADASMTPLA